MKKTYRLLKIIELEDSIAIGETFEEEDFIKLGDGGFIPAYRLLKEWYIEVVIPEWTTKARVERNNTEEHTDETFAEIILRHMPKN